MHANSGGGWGGTAEVSGTVSSKFAKSPQSGELQGQTHLSPVRTQEPFMKYFRALEPVGRLLHG